jgi:hypothetical protein
MELPLCRVTSSVINEPSLCSLWAQEIASHVQNELAFLSVFAQLGCDAGLGQM